MARIRPHNEAETKAIWSAVGYIHPSVDDDVPAGETVVSIKAKQYTVHTLTERYDEYFQIAGKIGDICVFRYLTADQWTTIEWQAVEQQKAELEKYMRKLCDPIDAAFTIELLSCLYT